jgi:hypothetical protein
MVEGMASLVIEHDELVVRLSQLEQIAAVRGDLHVPLCAVRSVSAEKAPYAALRGIRAPGTCVPRTLAYGVRLLTGGRPDFAALHGRGPAVRVELAPEAAFGRLLVTVEDPGAAVAALQEVVGHEAAG